MTAIPRDAAGEAATLPSACWRIVGVRGDKSCPELARVTHCHSCPTFARAAWSLFDRPAAPPDQALPVDTSEEAMQLAATPKSERVERLFLFSLGDHVCALDCAMVDEVSADAPVRRIAHRTAGLLEGLVNVRGELTLSVALDRLLGFTMTGRPSDGSRVPRPCRVIVGSSGQTWSFRASAVLGVHYVASSAMEPAPPALPSPLDTLLRALVRLPANALAGTTTPVVVNVLDGKALLSSFAQSA